GINILNRPDSYYDPSTWWDDYNKPWLDTAIKRGDEIHLATIPTKKGDIVDDSGKLIGSYAEELNHLANKGYKPSNVTDKEWDDILEWLGKKPKASDDIGVYSTKIKWGIHEIEARPYGNKGYWGKRIPQSDTKVEMYELKINPNNESFYLQNSEGSFVQFENLVSNTLQDGKLVINKSSIYHVLDKPEFLRTEAILIPAKRQIEVAKEN